MSNSSEWFDAFRQSRAYEVLKEKPLAYFCAEIALSDALPTYAGGLGILAGDYIKELYDQKIPAFGVSLCYRDRYPGNKVIEKDQIFSKEITPQAVGLEEVLDKDGKPLIVNVPIQDTDVFARVWLWQKDSIPVYLLDTDCVENIPEHRAITHKLYIANKETRLKQEMILGIGGYRLLEKLNITPSLFHINEGHSALLALEIIRHEMQKRNVGFQEALRLSLHHLIFTNHTLVAAGNEVFSRELFTLLLERYAAELEVPVMEIFNIGAIQDANSFSLSLFALRLAGKSNAVSILHGQQAKKIWPDYVFESITNGIHVPTWDKIVLGNSNEIAMLREGNGEARNDVNAVGIIKAHKENKRLLLQYIKKQTERDWKEEDLILGWARRMVRYKRPLALFGEIEMLKLLTQNYAKPFRIIVSGSAHPADDEGIQIVNTIQEIIKEGLSGSIIYLPDYKKELTHLLVSGTDLWLNTPVVGSEACGTSGMKAGLNGSLPVATKDGWMYEVDFSEIGWELDNETIHEDIIRILQDEVIPEFFQNRPRWQQRMKNVRSLILQQYSTTRMLKDYLEKLYLPVISESTEHYFSH